MTCDQSHLQPAAHFGVMSRPMLARGSIVKSVKSHSAKTVLRKRHFPIHAGEKPFSCKYCSYSSNRIDTLKSMQSMRFYPTHSGTLRQHELTHTEEKPFKCNQCSYSANRYRTLTIELNELPFLCFCRCFCICPGVR